MTHIFRILFFILAPMDFTMGFAQTTSEQIHRCLLRTVNDLGLDANHKGDAKTRKRIIEDFEDQLIAKLKKMPQKIQTEVLAALEDVRINDTDFKNPKTLASLDHENLKIRLRKSTAQGKILSLMFLAHEFDHLEFFIRRKHMHPLLQKLDISYHPVNPYLRTELQAHGFQYDIVQSMFKAAGDPGKLFRFIMQESGIPESDAHDMALILEAMRIKYKRLDSFHDPDERLNELIMAGKLDELTEKVLQLLNHDLGLMMAVEINSQSRKVFASHSLSEYDYLKKYGNHWKKHKAVPGITLLATLVTAYWLLKHWGDSEERE